MQRGWVKLMHAPACISVLHCDVLQEWWDEQTNEAGIPSVGNTQAMQEQRRHRQQHYTASLTRTPTCPNPTRLIQACHTAAKNTATHSTVCRYNCLTRYISNNLLSLTCTHTDRQYFSCAKRMNCFGLESQDNHSSQVSISWLSELSWHKSKEGLQDKLWIRARVLMNVPALPFLSSCVPSAPSSTLPPASLNTHTHTTAYMVTKAMVTSLSTAAICVERVSIRAWRRLWLKILGLQHAQTESDGRTEAERTGQDEKKNCSI